MRVATVPTARRPTHVCTAGHTMGTVAPQVRERARPHPKVTSSTPASANTAARALRRHALPGSAFRAGFLQQSCRHGFGSGSRGDGRSPPGVPGSGHG